MVAGATVSTWTVTGSVSTSCASLRISVGMVAEKSRVCRFGGRCSENAPDVGEKAHVEHLVGLVEHQHLQPAEVDGPLPDMVEEPPGTGDDDLGAALQLLHLRD